MPNSKITLIETVIKCWCKVRSDGRWFERWRITGTETTIGHQKHDAAPSVMDLVNYGSSSGWEEITDDEPANYQAQEELDAKNIKEHDANTDSHG